MRRKYSEAERKQRERERISRANAAEDRKREKESSALTAFYITLILLSYKILRFIGVFKFIKYIFLKIINFIQYIFLKIINLIPASIKFIFVPLSKKDTLLIFRLISFALRLNLIFFMVLFIVAMLFALL
tara:strand:+ start:118 stop:507 length:390 start_codon:yes stop_codon:yes gene_type:complete